MTDTSTRAGGSPAASAGNERKALRKFLVELASDLDRLCSFIADPQAVATEAGLGEEDRALLFSGDQGRIYAALRPDLVPSVQTPTQASVSDAGAAPPAVTPFVSGSEHLSVPGYAGMWPTNPWQAYPYLNFNYFWPTSNCVQPSPAQTPPSPSAAKQEK
jgi:hypothetical protein